MNATEIKNEGLELHYRVVLPVTNLNQEINSILAKLAKTEKMPGFRPGKVPMKIIDQKYRFAAINTAVENQINSSVSELLKQYNYKLATSPKVDDVNFEEGKDIEFTLILEKMPEIHAIDFSTLNIENPIIKLQDEEVNSHIKTILQSRPQYKKAAKTAKSSLNDKLIINFEGFLDGVGFDGGKGENFPLVLGSKTFIPGFEDQLIGHKAGAEVTVKVTFPDNYHAKDLKGKDTEFKVTILEILKIEEIEINDESAQEAGFKDLEEIKTRMIDVLTDRFNDIGFLYKKIQLFNELEKLLNFDIPNSLRIREEEALFSQLNESKATDPDLKDKSEEELKEIAKKISLRRIRIGLLLSNYADQVGLKVTPDDYYAEINKQIMAYPSNREQIMDFYQKNRQALTALSGPILEDKAVLHILGNKVKNTNKEFSIEELQKVASENEASL